jgi:molybdenum cofactor biosynthesis enzyme MoaA
MASRVEIGIVGVGPAPEQLTTPELPETVVINFAKVCNLWCHHCLYQEVTLTREAAGKEHKEELFLPPDTMRAVADELATWSTPAIIRIAADGEPLIHPHALPMIRHIKARGLTLSITTNGILLTERLIRDLLDSQIDVIDISIDAATAETFARVRPSRGTVNFYPVVERNVLALIAARNERGAATKVMVNLIDQPDAHEDVPLFIDQWTKRGADAVLIRPFHSTSAQTIQPGVITLRPRTDAPTRFACKFPFTRMNVGFDHDGAPIVYYCSHDWTDKTIVGVLGRDGSLRDIWHGAAMEEIRRRHRENDYPAGSFCATCPDWYLGWGKSHSGLVEELKARGA